jgi:hypothetical protein
MIADPGQHDERHRLVADETTPWINVWQLAETAFCERAGVLALESKRDDRGEDEDGTARLDYLRDYVLALIDEQLEATWQEIYVFCRWGLWYVLMVACLGLVTHWGYTALACVPAYFPCKWLRGQLSRVRVLWARRRAALAAVGREPNPNSTEVQTVNWWDLHKAGFQVMCSEEPLPVERLHLSGRPWRMLQKHDLGIPVFRKHFGQRKISRQHFARLAAYCYLIEQNEGLRSPYGLVLFHDSYEVLVLPNAPASRKAFHEALIRARELAGMTERERGSLEEPSNTACCKGCVWGKPRPYIPGTSDTVLNGKTWDALVTSDRRGRPCHSPCGDRYGWIPPHELAQAKGLLD